MVRDEFLVLARATVIIKRFEGLRLSPYLCSASVATIGFGATFYEDGTKVTLKDPPITLARAEALLDWHIKTVYLPAVVKLCPALVHESSNRIAAIISWTFNLGAGQLKSSTLRKRINSGDWEDVPAQIRKWTRAGGVTLKGLTLRREAEARMVEAG